MYSIQSYIVRVFWTSPANKINNNDIADITLKVELDTPVKQFEDTRVVIRSRKSKDRQCNCQKKKDKMSNNDLQNTIQKTKYRTKRTPQNPRVNSCTTSETCRVSLVNNEARCKYAQYIECDTGHGIVKPRFFFTYYKIIIKVDERGLTILEPYWKS